MNTYERRPEDYATEDEEVLVIVAMRRRGGTPSHAVPDEQLERVIDHMLKVMGYWARIEYQIRPGTRQARM